MKSPRILAGFATCCVVLLSACGSSSGEMSTIAPEDLNLSGTWVLNMELSDNPEQIAQQGGRRGGGMAGGRGGRSMGGGGRRGGMRGGAPSQADQQRMMQTTRMATQPPRRMIVEQNDSTVTIQRGNGQAHVLKTNWEKVRQEMENGGHLDIRARWQGRELQVERDVHLGGKVTRVYSLSSDGERLIMETRLDMGGGRQPRVLHFVYDQARR